MHEYARGDCGVRVCARARRAGLRRPRVAVGPERVRRVSRSKVRRQYYYYINLNRGQRQYY